MSDKLTPGDVQRFLLFEQIKAQVQLRHRQSPDVPMPVIADEEITRARIPDNWALLDYDPDRRTRRWRWHTVRKFERLKATLIQAAKHGGAEALDAMSLFKLEVLQTRLQYGQWLNRKSRNLLQAAIKAGTCTVKEIESALWSWGGLATSDGRLYANPVGMKEGCALGTCLAIVLAIFFWSVAAMVTQIFSAECRPCVVFGAGIAALMMVQPASIFYDLTIRRHRCAKVLMKAGIPLYSTCPKNGRWSWMQFLHWGDPPFHPS